ncbi:Peptide chain release factor 2, programmed frameshift-containing [Salinispira pacifica]|uniref:Peptide chain release factor 2 n=1 Tax=Salinispira pacifica TaxID=1307761 RepID=V5WEL0_9SPIO|nr:Peptide chain release factor 2, programmed frameshift-containing [Salinispira pacifica]
MTHGGLFDSDALKEEVARLEGQTSDPEFWNDRARAEKIMTQIKQMRDRWEPWEEMTGQIDDLLDLFEMAKAEGDDSLEDDIRATLEELQNRYDKLRVLELLSDQHDPASCYLTIHSGAGGTEACDWVSMLLRMYSRWIESRGYKAQTLDLQEAEGGIKSVTLEVDGAYAYGYLKSETGVHRLVRISPFDSSGRRHTSFASVYASPVIDDEIDVDVAPDDIRVDTYRAGGAGGQHVNKTDSAVRITHLETGIVVQCQNERSQHKNKDRAMKMLKSRLYDYYKAKQEEEKQENAAEKLDISWGSQIRSYVFQPYTMVKDARTKTETGNIQAVMDGGIDDFIESYLKMKWDESQ